MDEMLVIPDVHGRLFWKDAVESHPEMPVIFLGDYHDPYPSEGITEEDSLANFREILDYAASHDNVQLLLGNHDLHYLCNFGEACRLDYDNYAEIRKMLLDNIDRMKIARLLEIGEHRVVFSHAPILKEWISSVGLPDNPEEIVARLNKVVENIEANPEDAVKLLGQISTLRGGWDQAGSPVWADCREINGNLLSGVDYSIFGHTQLAKEFVTDSWADLDSRGAFILSPDLTLTRV